jgi:hypothetical protein
LRCLAGGFNRVTTLFVPNCAAVWPVPSATPAANTAVLIVADQTRKNRSARIVGNCCFFRVRDAQSACNSRREDYLFSQRNLIASRTMNTTSNSQQSAKIYQFPVGGRRAVEGNREVTPTVSTFGSWYHEAAIQEAAAQNHREH